MRADKGKKIEQQKIYVCTFEQDKMSKNDMKKQTHQPVEHPSEPMKSQNFGLRNSPLIILLSLMNKNNFFFYHLKTAVM